MSPGDTQDLTPELEAELRLSAGLAAVIKQTITRPRAPLPAQFGTRHVFQVEFLFEASQISQMLAANLDEVKTPKKSSRLSGCKRHIENETTLGALPTEPLPKASQPKRLKRAKEAAAQEPKKQEKIEEEKQEKAPKPEEKKEKEEEVKINAAAKETPKKEAPKPEEKEKEVNIDSAEEASKPEAKKEAPKPEKEELPQQQKIESFQRFLASVKVIEGGTSCADIGVCNADFTQILLARLCNSDSEGVRETAGASNYGLK